MTSAEIREKIAELKIRLAFQLEFEEELEKTLAECEEANSEPEKQITDRNAKILREIEAETKKRSSRNVGRRRTRRVGRIIAVAAILMTISCGSALAAICGLVEAGILKFDIKVQEKGTIFELLQIKNKIDIPEGWQGKYYPTYIPEGYCIKNINEFGVRYVDESGNEIGFSEKPYGRRNDIDTENALVSNETLNGIEAMVMEKNGRTSIVWNADDRYFVVEVHEGREMALRIAASVSLINR